jgi:sorbitol-specific phosphotransferase system component IIBC
MSDPALGILMLALIVESFLALSPILNPGRLSATISSSI